MGHRTASNWRYRTIKKYKHRAQKFLESATTKEEKEAWQKVIDWFDSILRTQRHITVSGALGLHEEGKPIQKEYLESYDKRRIEIAEEVFSSVDAK